MAPFVRKLIRAQMLLAVVVCLGGCQSPLQPAVESPATPEKQPPPLPKPIDLGSSLFESGSNKFKANATAQIDEKVAELPVSTTLDIEVFRDTGLVHHRDRMRQGGVTLNTARGEAVRKYLSSKGYTIRRIVDRDVAQSENFYRQPGRRVELVPVRPEPPK